MVNVLMCSDAEATIEAALVDTLCSASGHAPMSLDDNVRELYVEIAIATMGAGNSTSWAPPAAMPWSLQQSMCDNHKDCDIVS